MIRIALMVGCLLFSLPVSIRAQGEKWQRVYTGEDSIIDLDASSSTFAVGHVLRVTFRTTLAKPESLKEEPGTKVKRRLETFEFKLIEKRYRIHEIRLLTSAGKVVQSYWANASEDWKAMKLGGMMQRLFDAARQLPPFGEWKVVDYRFGDGTPSDAQRIRTAIGTHVRLDSDAAQVGTKVCSLPAYQSKLLTDKEFFRELGISLESIGIKANQADTIAVKCEAHDWAPPQSLLVKLPEGGMLMLWEGVFLELKNDKVQSSKFNVLKRSSY